MKNSILVLTLLFSSLYTYAQEVETIEYAKVDGGKMMVIYPRAERYIFSEKSIVYRIEYDYLLPLEKKMTMDEPLWQNLKDSYRSTAFKQLEDGVCGVCVDGIDAEVKVTEKNGTSKKAVNNFPESAISTEGITKLIQYFKENNEIKKGLLCGGDIFVKSKLIGTWYFEDYVNNSKMYNHPIKNWSKKYEIDSNFNVKVIYSEALKVKKFDPEYIKKFDKDIGKLNYNTETELLEIEFENAFYIVNHRDWTNKNEIQVLGWNK